MPLSQQQISVMKCHALIYCFNCFNLQDRETFRRTTDANILKVLGASRPLLQVCYNVVTLFAEEVNILTTNPVSLLSFKG